MTASELSGLIVASAALLTALGTFAVSLATLFRTANLAHSVNGQSEALNSLTAKASFAAGKLEAGSGGGSETRPVGRFPTAPP